MYEILEGIERVVEQIKIDAAAECERIAQEAAEECARIRAQYAQTEQDEYWKMLGTGAKETEKRVGQLNDLASQESKKQVLATQQEMIDATFDLAQEKLLNLSKREYAAILERHSIKSDCMPDALIARFKEELSPEVSAALFE
jgi:vacuolar-type H+-ATPase subunit E/Vma4